MTTTETVYDGARRLHRRATIAQIHAIEADMAALEHRASSIVKFAVQCDGPLFGARIAGKIVDALDGMADEVARLHHRIDTSLAGAA